MPPMGTGVASFEHFIRKVTGQAPRDLSLYEKALSRVSFASRLDSNRLAWQGGEVFHVLATERMLRDYPGTNVTRLSQLRNAVVSRFNLARAAKSIGLDTHVQVQGESRDSDLEFHAVVLEAFVGAAYLDTKSIMLAKQIVDRPMSDCEVFALSGDAKLFLDIKTARVGSEHNGTFQSTATSIFDPILIAVATGTTAKPTEQHAALEYMRTYGPVFIHSDKAGDSFNSSTYLPSRNIDFAGFLKLTQTLHSGILKFTENALPSGKCEVTATSIFDSTLRVTATAGGRKSATLAAMSLYFDTYGPVFKRVEPVLPKPV